MAKKPSTQNPTRPKPSKNTTNPSPRQEKPTSSKTTQQNTKEWESTLALTQKNTKQIKRLQSPRKQKKCLWKFRTRSRISQERKLTTTTQQRQTRNRKQITQRTSRIHENLSQTQSQPRPSRWLSLRLSTLKAIFTQSSSQIALHHPSRRRFPHVWRVQLDENRLANIQHRLARTRSVCHRPRCLRGARRYKLQRRSSCLWIERRSLSTSVLLVAKSALLRKSWV